MTDFAQHLFDTGRAYAEALTHQSGPSVVVTPADLDATGSKAGEALRFPGCVADVFENHTLTITALASGDTVREFPAGAWIDATVLSADGQIVYVLTPGGRR